MSPGLCGHCRHCQVVDTARSRFYLCRRALTDHRFRKYPVLPVRACPGYEEDLSRQTGGGATDEGASGTSSNPER